MKTSSTFKAMQAAANLREQGFDVIDLTVGEPDFPTPQFIKDLAIEGLEKNITRYTPSAGMKSFTEAVAHFPEKSFEIVSREFHMVPIFIVYMIGITATVWHFANGIWLFLVDWGIAIGERAQRLAGYACIGFGIVLLAVGINAAIAFIRPGGLLRGIL